MLILSLREVVVIMHWPGRRLGGLQITRPPQVRPLIAYGFAVAVTLLLTALQHALIPFVELVPFILAAFLAAWVGGKGPGLVAAALSVVIADYHFLPPENAWSSSSDALVHIGLFSIVSTIVVLLCSALREALALTVYQLDLTRRITENAAEAIFVTDMTGCVTFANRQAEVLFGFTASELKGQVLHNAVHHHYPDGAPFPAAECLMEQIHHRGEAVCKHEGVFFRKDGTALDVSCSDAALEGDGERVGAVFIVRDISERKRTEQALREKEADLNRAQAVAQTGSWRLDIQRNELLWSDETYRLFGVPKDVPLTYEVFLATSHPEDRELVDKAWQAALRGAPYDIEHRIVVAGEVKWVRERAELELDVDGNLRGGFGTVQDITVRKRADEALRAADQRKDEFLAMLSHELRNPLAPIRNSMYVLDRAPPGSEQAQRAKAVIDRQVRHLVRLVDDLLDMTRVARGKVQLQSAPLEIVALARGAVEDHQSVFDESGVDVVVETTEEQLWVNGDKTRLSQVLGNLLQNAAKFTARGGRTVVRIEVGGQPRQVKLRVIDTGIGIPPHLLVRLFEPFSQAEMSLARSKGGLGLGLALVKGLVNLHGGSVEARSEGVGQGAEFVIGLPLRAPPEHQVPASYTPTQAAGRKRVLVIEDNADAAESFREALELSGHVVATAATGVEGLDKARAFDPDILLCDVGLPDMDGYDIARRMRSDPDLSSVYLVAVTGYAQPEDRSRATSAGFDLHLAKPVDLDELEQALAGLEL